MPRTCILCATKTPIKNSHVIPRFVIRRLKEGSPLQTLIHSDQLNQVFQDGWKGDYLCDDCEARFSRWEAWFCQQVYDPFLSGQTIDINYGSELGLFTASLCFRYIRFTLDKNNSKPIPPALAALYQNLRTGLLENSLSATKSYPYLQFLFPVANTAEFPPGINTYYFESIDGKLFTYVFSSEPEFWLVYIKLPSLFIILSPIDLKRTFVHPQMLAGHEISDSGRLVSHTQTGLLSKLVSDIFCERAKEIQENYSRLNPKRAQKIEQEIARLPEKEKFRAHQSYMRDQQLLTDWRGTGEPPKP